MHWSTKSQSCTWRKSSTYANGSNFNLIRLATVTFAVLACLRQVSANVLDQTALNHYGVPTHTQAWMSLAPHLCAPCPCDCVMPNTASATDPTRSYALCPKVNEIRTAIQYVCEGQAGGGNVQQQSISVHNQSKTLFLVACTGQPKYIEVGPGIMVVRLDNQIFSQHHEHCAATGTAYTNPSLSLQPNHTFNSSLQTPYSTGINGTVSDVYRELIMVRNQQWGLVNDFVPIASTWEMICSAFLYVVGSDNRKYVAGYRMNTHDAEMGGILIKATLVAGHFRAEGKLWNNVPRNGMGEYMFPHTFTNVKANSQVGTLTADMQRGGGIVLQMTTDPGGYPISPCYATEGCNSSTCGAQILPLTGDLHSIPLNNHGAHQSNVTPRNYGGYQHGNYYHANQPYGTAVGVF